MSMQQEVETTIERPPVNGPQFSAPGTSSGTDESVNNTFLAEQRKSLRQMKMFATGLLILMTSTYFMSRLFASRYPVLGAVAAFSEAATVGALADWFAVVALFRHPLNLPIPKTAVIQRNRDRIADALARFIREHFLSRDILQSKIDTVDPAGLLGAWLSDESNAERVARRAGEYLPHIVEQFARKDDGQGNAAQEGAGSTVKATFLALTQAIAAPIRQSAIIRKMGVTAERLWYKVVSRDRVATEQTDNTGDAPFSHPTLKQYLPLVWNGLRDRLLKDLADPDPELILQISKALQEMGRAISTDENLKEKLNQWLRAWTARAVSDNRDLLVTFISETVRKWDPETTSRRIELHVGRDLQWIRINGTIIGGLAGLLIYFLSWLMNIQ